MKEVSELVLAIRHVEDLVLSASNCLDHTTPDDAARVYRAELKAYKVVLKYLNERLVERVEGELGI